MNVKYTTIAVLLLLLTGFAYYLFRPLPNIPAAAEFTCLDLQDGFFISRDSLPIPQTIYGMGLTYSQHLVETAAKYDPSVLPPIFKKKIHSITGHGSKVKIPTKEEMIEACGEIDQGISNKLRTDFEDFSPMLDYEVELGFVLLKNISSAELEDDHFVPPLGYFIGNDISARSVGLMGEGTDILYDYWGISKSFPGFLPMSREIWIPNSPASNSMPCIKLETHVNGEIRQSQTTDNMIFTNLEMLRFIQKKYPNTPLLRGDVVLTGTPGGVAIATPKVLVRLANLIGFNRYQKLSIKLRGDLSKFLKNGDSVTIKGEGFKDVQVEIVL